MIKCKKCRYGVGAGKNDVEISREVGTSKSYVARWRRGECLPPNQVGGKRCKPLAGG